MVFTEADRMYAEYCESVKERKEKSIANMKRRGETIDESVAPSDVAKANLSTKPYSELKGHEAENFEVAFKLKEAEEAPPPEKVAIPVYEVAVPEEPEDTVQPAYNQWTAKHIYEDHQAFWNREWNEHNRNVLEASPLYLERQEQDARLVAAKQRERENAKAAYGYHYRGEQDAAASEPWQYPFHRSQAGSTYSIRSYVHLRPAVWTLPNDVSGCHHALHLPQT
jgi:hypothetical protein